MNSEFERAVELAEEELRDCNFVNGCEVCQIARALLQAKEEIERLNSCSRGRKACEAIIDGLEGKVEGFRKENFQLRARVAFLEKRPDGEICPACGTEWQSGSMDLCGKQIAAEREAEKTRISTLESESARLREALRKAVLWAESASTHITERGRINWRTLNEARSTLSTPATKEKGVDGLKDAVIEAAKAFMDRWPDSSPGEWFDGWFTPRKNALRSALFALEGRER